MLELRFQVPKRTIDCISGAACGQQLAQLITTGALFQCGPDGLDLSQHTGPGFLEVVNTSRFATTKYAILFDDNM